MKRKTKRHILTALFTTLAIAGGVCGFYYAMWYKGNKVPAFNTHVHVYVSDTTTVSGVVHQIGAAAISPKTLRHTFASEGLKDTNLTRGHYLFDETMSAAQAARYIRFGWQSPVKITIAGPVRRKTQLAKQIAAQTLLDSAEVYNALCDDEFLARYGFSSQNVQAMIIPDTYEVYLTVSLRNLFDRFKKEYDAYWTKERVELARAQGLTPLQVSILASIVDLETNIEADKPKIASVYITRLNKRMKLGACPTVAYLYDYQLRRVLNEHIRTKSPYNTYLNYGLPPGPICTPSKSALNAVLMPAPDHYLYFCASPAIDGTTVFSKTLAEHNRNAAAYHKAITERQKAKEKEKEEAAL